MELQDVKDLAKYLHRKQNYDQYPYEFHLSSTELVARWFAMKNPERFENWDYIFQACWLHDCLEDTSTTKDSLMEMGVDKEVIDIIWAVTDGKGRNRVERKKAVYDKCNNFPEAIFVKLCDRIANVEHSYKSNSALRFMYRTEQSTLKEHFADYFPEMISYLDIILNI